MGNFRQKTFIALFSEYLRVEQLLFVEGEGYELKTRFDHYAAVVRSTVKALGSDFEYYTTIPVRPRQFLNNLDKGVFRKSGRLNAEGLNIGAKDEWRKFLDFFRTDFNGSYFRHFLWRAGKLETAGDETIPPFEECCRSVQNCSLLRKKSTSNNPPFILICAHSGSGQPRSILSPDVCYKIVEKSTTAKTSPPNGYTWFALANGILLYHKSPKQCRYQVLTNREWCEVFENERIPRDIFGVWDPRRKEWAYAIGILGQSGAGHAVTLVAYRPGTAARGLVVGWRTISETLTRLFQPLKGPTKCIGRVGYLVDIER